MTDCKALFDAARCLTSGRHVSEKHTSIEIQMTDEKMSELHCSGGRTQQQLADGMTMLACEASR